MFLARASCCSPVTNNLQICRCFSTPWRAFFDSIKRQERTVKETPLDDDLARYANDEYHWIPLGESDVANQASVSFLSRSLKRDKLINIKTISKFGFRTHDHCYLLGPVAIFPKTALSWRVPSPDDITPESLELFFLLQPKLDVLVIGVGDQKDIDSVRNRIVPALKKERMGYEILPTVPIATFNFLNGVDNRYVGAALFPPAEIKISNEKWTRVLYQETHGKWEELSDPDRWFHQLDSPQPIVTVAERIWGYGEESTKALELIRAFREEKGKMRMERLEEKIEKDKRERFEAFAATQERRRLEAERMAEEEKKLLKVEGRGEKMDQKNLPKNDEK
uniref:NADH dehydrogenase [ubiquinone] 1 alpha subcomplex assembly factor 3 n=1 Tax=Globodera pallida TaxID=36090 RepID=A0A183CIQ1_GLOPA